MYLAMDIGGEGGIEAHSSTELTDDWNQGNEVLT
jgi:hypothetical protein